MNGHNIRPKNGNGQSLRDQASGPDSARARIGAGWDALDEQAEREARAGYDLREMTGAPKRPPRRR